MGEAKQAAAFSLRPAATPRRGFVRESGLCGTASAVALFAKGLPKTIGFPNAAQSLGGWERKELESGGVASVVMRCDVS